MAVLNIPARYQPGVSVIAGMSESSYTDLLRALLQAPSGFDTERELAAWISSEVKTVPSTESAKIIRTLVSLYRLRSKQENLTVQELARDITVAAREIHGIKTAEGIDLAQRLESLLGIASLNTTAFKAKELQLESERTFCQARIITDLRPVFSENLEGTPPMMVVHTLKLGFHEKEHKDIYVALDEADIAALKKTLQRAEEKSQKLKSILDASGIKTIEVA